MDFYSAGLSIKTVDVSQRIITGYAAAHHNIDRVRDIIDPQASVKAQRRITDPKKDVAVFIGHQHNDLPVGHPLVVQATPQGLYTETYVYKGPAGDNLLAVAKDMQERGIPLGMSIGYRTHDSRNEATARGRVRRILDYELKEYSFAAHQTVANPLATAIAVKAKRAKALSEGADTTGGYVTKDGGPYPCQACIDGDEEDCTCPGCEAGEDCICCAMLAGDNQEEDGGDKTMAKDKLMKEAHDEATMDDGDADDKAVWSTAFVNDLPNSAFLYVEPGDDDEGGKRVPRSKRHFPYKGPDGTIDLPHLRNAIARIPQSDAPGLNKDAVQARARRLLERADGGKTADEPAEWKTGNPIALRSIGYRLIDISERTADELKAMRLLGEDTKDNQRIRKPLRDELAALQRELKSLLEWADTIERGADAAAILERYRYERDALFAL